jgi:hypothetical protein
MTTFTTEKVIEMVALAVGDLAGRKIDVTLESGEKLTKMSLKNFVIRSVAEQLKKHVDEDEVAKALEHYDPVVMPLEDIVSVGQITGGHRGSRKTRRRHK